MLLVDFGLIQQHQHLPGAGDDVPPPEELDALAQRIDAGLFVERKAHGLHLAAYFHQAAPQIVLVWVDDDKIIHVADVVSCAQALLDVVVQVVEHQQLHQLADLAAETQTTVSSKAVDHVADGLGGPRIAHILIDGGLGRVVWRGRKEMLDVALEHPALGAVLVVVPAQMCLEPLVRIRDATPHLAGQVIPDKMLHDVLV